MKAKNGSPSGRPKRERRMREELAPPKLTLKTPPKNEAISHDELMKLIPPPASNSAPVPEPGVHHALPDVIEPDEAIMELLPEEYPLKDARTGRRGSAGTGAKLWNRAVATEVLLRIASGATLREVARLPEMPSPVMWSRWVLAVPKLRELWNEAQRMRASAMFDEAIDEARALSRRGKGVTSEMVAAVRLLIDTLKYGAARLSPKEYGERADNTPVVGIKIITDLDLNFDGREGMQGEIIDIPDEEVAYSVKAPIPAPAPALAKQEGDAGENVDGRLRSNRRRTAPMEDKRGEAKRERKRKAVFDAIREIEQ